MDSFYFPIQIIFLMWSTNTKNPEGVKLQFFVEEAELALMSEKD